MNKVKPVFSINVSDDDLKKSCEEIERRINGIYGPFVEPTDYTGKDIERGYSWRDHWMNSPELKKWIEKKFEELLKDKNYKSQYYGENEFNRIRERHNIKI